MFRNKQAELFRADKERAEQLAIYDQNISEAMADCDRYRHTARVGQTNEERMYAMRCLEYNENCIERLKIRRRMLINDMLQLEGES